MIIDRADDENIDMKNVHNIVRRKGRKKQLSKLVSASLEQPLPTPIPEDRQQIGSVDVKNVVNPYTAAIYNETGDPHLPNFFNFFTTLRNDELCRKWITLPEELECTCSCQDGCKPQSCPCYQANLQINGRQAFSTVDSKNGRIQLKNGTPFSSDRFIVACGRGCACHPDHPDHNKEEQECNRNVDNLKLDTKFEVFCHPIKGYCLRTLKKVEGCKILGELTGYVIKSKRVREEEDDEINDEESGDETEIEDEDEDEEEDEHISHAMDLYTQEEFAGFLAQLRSLERFKKLKNLEKTIGQGSFYVQAFEKSSFMRLCAHSCLPNAGFIKVVANNFHPSNRRLFYVSFHPIEANEEVTISYGSFYVKNNLDGCCCCGTSICLNKKGRFTEEADLVIMDKTEAVKLTEKYIMSIIKKVGKERKTKSDSEDVESASPQSANSSDSVEKINGDEMGVEQEEEVEHGTDTVEMSEQEEKENGDEIGVNQDREEEESESEMGVDQEEEEIYEQEEEVEVISSQEKTHDENEQINSEDLSNFTTSEDSSNYSSSATPSPSIQLSILSAETPESGNKPPIEVIVLDDEEVDKSRKPVKFFGPTKHPPLITLNDKEEHDLDLFDEQNFHINILLDIFKPYGKLVYNSQNKEPRCVPEVITLSDDEKEAPPKKSRPSWPIGGLSPPQR